MGTRAVCLATVPPSQMEVWRGERINTLMVAAALGRLLPAQVWAEPSQAGSSPLGTWREAGPTGLGDCWEVLAPSPIQDGDGC